MWNSLSNRTQASLFRQRFAARGSVVLALMAACGVATGCSSGSDETGGATDASVGTGPDAGPVVYGTPGPSCNGGLDCKGVDCCQSILVPGGTFPMGRSASGTDAYTYDAGSVGGLGEQPEHNATVDSFYLDTFEVTVGRFRKFVAAYNGTPPTQGAGDHHGLGAGWQSAWNPSLPASQANLITNLKCDSAHQTWTDAVGTHEKWAINCVNWFEAMAFCLWDGGRLPTEAEWEYASAGGTDNRLYPWGATDPFIDKTLANDLTGEASPFVNVGSYPNGKGKWGHQDLAGGMWEWAMDWFDGEWYTGTGSTCSNCGNTGTSAASFRVLRGGSCREPYYNLRAALRYFYLPAFRNNDVGFRCVRNQ